MGNEQSALVEESNGFHVLRVTENSPAHEAGIQPFFDFILSINGTRLDKPGSDLTDQLLANVGKEVTLLVYSSKDQNVREVKLTPNSQWSDSTKDGLIGCAIRFCTYAAASENVWHILDVAPNSPAATAGLQAHTDYVIGTMHRHLETQADFSRLMEEHQGMPVQLLVYNRHWDTCREVTIVPDKNWGGQGSLGCDVGYGSYIIVTCTESQSDTILPTITRTTTLQPKQQRRARSPTPSPMMELQDFRWDPKSGPRPKLPWADDDDDANVASENKIGNNTSIIGINEWMPATIDLRSTITNPATSLQRKISTASAIGRRLRLTTKRHRTNDAPVVAIPPPSPLPPSLTLSTKPKVPLGRSTTVASSSFDLTPRNKLPTRSKTTATGKKTEQPSYKNNRHPMSKSATDSRSTTALSRSATSIYTSNPERQHSNMNNLPPGLALAAMQYRQPNYLRTLTKIHVC